MRYGAIAALACCVGAAPVAAQAGTDIWLTTLVERNGVLRAGVPENVTRRPGYDNQPHFTPDGRGVWFTRIEEGRADIARYDLASARIEMVTRTPESEYSATPVPGRDAFSVIRVEADSTQRLWQFPLAGGAPSIVLPGVAPVGYQAWADANTLVLFVLGQPATLQVATVPGGATRVVATNPGRSIQKIPGRRAVSFAQRTEDGFRIDELDPATDRISPLTPARPGAEFHAWTPAGRLLMGEGAQLWSWTAAGGWVMVADFSDLGLRITRLAVSPAGDRLALVSDEPPGAPRPVLRALLRDLP